MIAIVATFGCRYYCSLHYRKEFHKQQWLLTQRKGTQIVADKSTSLITTHYRQIYTLRPKLYESRVALQLQSFGEVS